MLPYTAYVSAQLFADWSEVKTVYRFNETFEMEYGGGGMGGIMHCVCNRVEDTIISCRYGLFFSWQLALSILCRTEERKKLWNFTSKLIFSHGGLENVRTFLNNNIGK